MSTRTRSWYHRLAAALAVTIAATFGATLAESDAAQAGEVCPGYHVAMLRSNFFGQTAGNNIIYSNSEGQFTMDMRPENAANHYVAFGGETRPRRNAEFRFVNAENGQYVWFNARGEWTMNYKTTAAGDNGVIRQESNVLAWTGDLAVSGRKLLVYADFSHRCGGDDIRVHNVFVGTVTTYPAQPVDVDPKYLVLGVIYAPPAASSVNYGTSTTAGTKLGVTSSFQSGTSVSTSLTQGQTELIGASQNFSQKTQDSVSVTVEKTTSSSLTIQGPTDAPNGINHRFDRFAVWLNPRFTVTPVSPTEMRTGPFSPHPASPFFPDMDVVYVSVGELQDRQFAPGTASRLQRSWSSSGGLTHADFDQILTHNPFANGNTAIDPNRFDVVGGPFDYSPAPPGGSPITQGYGVSYRESVNTGVSLTLTSGFSVTGPPESVSLFNNALTQTRRETSTFEFSLGFSLDLSRTVGQSVNLSLTGPDTGYQGPTGVRALQDKVYGTIAFAFVDTATFRLATPSPNQTVTQGGSAAFPVTTQGEFGYNQPINFSGTVTGLPPGATASFSPASVNPGGGSTLTVATSPTTPAGTHHLTITANSGLITRHAKVNLTVAPRPFTVGVTPGTQVVSSTRSAVYTIDVAAAPGFTGPVQLSGPGNLPPGTSASLSTTTIAGGSGSATLTVNATPSAASTTRILTVTATGGSLSQQVQMTLVVDNSQDFGLSVTPQSAGIEAGQTASYTVTTTAVNGFTGNVGLTVSGHPTGSTASFSVNPVAGAGSSTLNIATSPSTPPGDYTLTVTGTSGSLTHIQTVNLSVSAPSATFSMLASPSTQSVPTGQSASFTVSTAAIGGFTGAIGLSVGAMPSGMSASFSPATVNPGAGSTLTVSVAPGTPATSYQFTVTATSGAISRTGTLTVDVTGQAAVLGYNQVGANLDSSNMNWINGSRIVTGASPRTISTIAVYLKTVQAAPNNQFQVAVYTDDNGSPGTLVASSTSGTLTANSWNSRPVSTTLAPDTAYWLMYNTNGDNNISFDQGGTSGWSAASVPFGTWPPGFGPSVPWDVRISMYAY